MFQDLIDEISYFLWDRGIKIIFWLIITSIIIGMFLFVSNLWGDGNINWENYDEKDMPSGETFDYQREREEYLKLFQTNNQLATLWVKEITDVKKIIQANEEVIFVDVNTWKKEKIIIKINQNNNSSDNQENKNNKNNENKTIISPNTEITLINVDTGEEKQVIILSEEDTLEWYKEIIVVDLETRIEQKIIIVYEEDVIDQTQINPIEAIEVIDETTPPETWWETGWETTPPETWWETGWETTPPETWWETGWETTPPDWDDPSSSNDEENSSGESNYYDEELSVDNEEPKELYIKRHMY